MLNNQSFEDAEEAEYYAKEIVDIAIKVHRALGPGLLESVYETCFCYELSKREIGFKNQVSVPIRYENLIVESALRLDIIVGGLVIIELKAQEKTNNIWEAQLLSYLRLTGVRLGFIINFHVPLVKDGIKRMVL